LLITIADHALLGQPIRGDFLDNHAPVTARELNTFFTSREMRPSAEPNKVMRPDGTSINSM
jgi:hypothetical protein